MATENNHLRKIFGNLVRSGLSSDDDSLELYQISRLNLAIMALVFCVPFFTFIYFKLGVSQISFATFLTGILAVLCFYWFRKTQNITAAANFLLLIYAALIFFAAIYLDGIHSSVQWWNTHLPVLAVLLLTVMPWRAQQRMKHLQN